MNLGKKVKVRMEELGMTQAELARASGLTRTYISEIVNNNRGGARTSVKLVRSLKKGLKVEDDFFSDVCPTK